MTENKKYKILIIEDEALVARELKGRLTLMGYEVVGIAFGGEGIDIARRTLPDLLLTDIHLKDGQDGIALAQAIQAERFVPVVFLTAYSDEETVSRAKAVTPYGYIIKPVENRELEITIEMALYKFNIEHELRETQQLLQTALTCIGSSLLFVDGDGRVTGINADAERLFSVERASVLGRSWLDVFSVDGDSSVGRKLALALASDEVTKLAPFVVSPTNSLPYLVDGIVGPMEPGAVVIVRELAEIHDRIEMLAAPTELLADMGAERLAPSESSMCQLLIGVDQAQAETASLMPIVSRRLNQMLRATDLVSRFGHNQLSVSMPYTAVTEGRQIAQSILKSLSSVEELPAEVTFSIGLSFTTPGDQQPFELFRRASWSLNVARESGGHRVIQWNENSEQPETGRVTESARHREYHNLVLLWNVMNVVVKAEDLRESSHQLARHILQSFNLDCAAVLKSNGESISLVGGSVQGLADAQLNDVDLTSTDLVRIRALLGSPAQHAQYDDRHLFALSDESVLLIVSGVSLAQTEIDFLQTLASYFATGFARADRDTASTADDGKGALLYKSARMQGIFESVKLVAPTDATVLVIGESGTGKEKLARAIHDASARADQPFVIVDCGAVVGSLIESELFGHVKGAFTGADRVTTGKLKEAHRGTVLLDEVGELPLDVQVKLLRFVQEHEIAAVGSNRYDKVDVRVIAATNRDLKSLVRDGGFREDLYYRLNVFTIETPPLRERDGDVILLARHFLGMYAAQYGKRINGFTMDAERALLEQRWPGNIRELMNLINRAVILCRDSLVSNIHLGLFPEASRSGVDLKPAPRVTLAAFLTEVVERVLLQGDLPPLAQWLEEDAILATLAINEDVLNRAAGSLGIPESTLRRKVARIRESVPTAARPRFTEAIGQMMPDLVGAAGIQGQPVLELVSSSLLHELMSRRLSRTVAAALMGVSLPTYRKLLNEAP